jgi:hypothetical protein
MTYHFNMRKNILYGDLIVIEKNKKKQLKNCVWTEGDLMYKNNKIINVLNSKVVGQTAINLGYTEVKKNDEIRNNITGAYE